MPNQRKENSKTTGFCSIGDRRQGRVFVVGFITVGNSTSNKEGEG